jgi:hypothetical protein
VKRVRITVGGLMMFVALVAFDLAFLPFTRGVMFGPVRGVIVGALPMANVLAIILATTVGSLRRRGEVALSRVMFLLFGGLALVLALYLGHLTPVLVFKYLDNTAGLWDRRRVAGNISVGFAVVRSVLHLAAVTAPILIPALIAAWATRGKRLRLEKRTDLPGGNESPG